MVYYMKKALYLLTAEEILRKLDKRSSWESVEIQGLKFMVVPEVFPSHYFRTTNFMLTNIRTFFKGKTVNDMGCGFGVIGLYAMYHGASYVVQVDINSHAVKNAMLNRDMHGISTEKICIY